MLTTFVFPVSKNSDSDSDLSDIDVSRMLGAKAVSLSLDKIESLVTSAAVTSDGEDFDSFQACQQRKERVRLIADTITEHAEKSNQQRVSEDHGDRVAFSQVCVYDWTWEGEDETLVELAGDWKRKAYADITSKLPSPIRNPLLSH